MRTAHRRTTKAYAPSTLQGQTLAVTRLQAFREEFHLNSMRHTTWSHMLAFLESLATRGHSPAVLTATTSHIRTYFRRNQWPIGQLEARPISDYLKAARKQVKRRPVKLPAINHKQFHAIRDTVTEISGRATDMLRMAVSLAYYGLLRVSNLAPYTARRFTAIRNLTIGSVRVKPKGISLTIPWTKTMQARRTPTKIFIPATGEPGCIKQAWQSYLQVVPDLRRRAPLLQWPSGSTVTVAALRHALEVPHSAVGVPGIACMHAYCRGGAQYYYRRGVPYDVIKRLGLWTTDAMLAYLQNTVPRRFTHKSYNC